ncbi:metallophosphoesterase [Peptoniphilus catoniae]|uniref:metallophosphoesterase n=1 Tax=Peptoniphilus catoniae TaxID=1660341 RepID=UPI0010FF1384|nr:metallophosphoesterase [Peptoniphilus catoniae]
MIWAIGDLHFDFRGEKPMDIFGDNWINHSEKIISDWKEKVSDEDLVLLVGDTSWALKFTDSFVDLRIIDNLPGKKIISKGNHDYWWTSLSKMREAGFKSIEFLHNNNYVYRDVGIFGSRGWYSTDTPGFNDQDEKIYNREILRLKNSFSGLENCKKKIAMIHYPPFMQNKEPNDFSVFCSERGVNLCLYGHLHGEGHKFIIEGKINKVDYKCVASDYVDFKLQEINI